jgi:hypothetical protein
MAVCGRAMLAMLALMATSRWRPAVAVKRHAMSRR